MDDPFAELSDSLVPESAFDQAFDGLDPVNRAWIKKNIAQLHAMHACSSRLAGRVERDWSQGLWSRQERRPLERAAVCFPSSLLANPRLLAAVLPPLAAGVRRCCAMRIGEAAAPWDPLVLGGLELAGVEEVYALDEENFAAWTEKWAGDGQTRLVFLEGAAPRQALGSVSGGHVLLPEVHRLGIWFEEPGEWDLEILRSFHPRARLLFGGPAAPQAASSREETVETHPEAFFASGCDALYVPSFQFEEAMSRCSRVFGPGQEGCWTWPELEPVTFFRSTLCLGQPAPDF